jgi:RNA polymerase sigma-70 factor (ECF subfamily)
MPIQQQEIEFSELLKRHYPIINSICLRCCGQNVFYFEELRQECVLAIWEEYSRYGLSRFRGDSAESTWIYQIAYHAAVHYLRNPKRQELPTIADPYEIETLTGTEASDDWHLLDELMERLNLRERNLLSHFLNDDSYSTIALAEGITEAGARKRMSRLLKKLKKMIYQSRQK